jgi:argininosuccinate lyase
MLDTMTVNRDSMKAAVDDDYLCATDLADYLVRNNVSFREAHHLIGQMISFCREKAIRLRELDSEARGKFHPSLAEKIDNLLDPALVAGARMCRGGTAPTAVKKQLEFARGILKKQI